MGVLKKVGIGGAVVFGGLIVIGTLVDPDTNTEGTPTREPTRGIAWKSSTPGASSTVSVKAPTSKATRTRTPNPTHTPRPKPTRTTRPTAVPTNVPTPQSAGFTWPVADVDCPEISYEYANWLLDQDPSDPFRLDRDGDGEACEQN